MKGYRFVRLAILLGLFLTSWGLLSSTPAYAAQAAHTSAAPIYPGASLNSIVAQVTVTGTTTVTEPVGPIIAPTTVTTVTATVATTATATVAAPPPPTVVVPVVNETPLQINPFDAGFLFSNPNPPMGPFAWGMFGLMIVLLGVSGYFYTVKRPHWKRENTVLYRAANRWSQPGLWLAITGLLLILFRLVSLDFFRMRIWLYVWLLVLLGMLVWFFYWYRTTYPKELEKFRKTQRARQYMPAGAAKNLARQPERTAPKAVPQPRQAQKGTTPPKPSGGNKPGKGK